MTDINTSILDEEFLYEPGDSIDFPVFHTVKLGARVNKDGLVGEIESAGHRAMDYIPFLVQSPDFTLGPAGEYDLVKATVGELGFSKQAGFYQVQKRVLDLGYHLCPPEIAFQLRLDRSYEPGRTELDNLHIMMDPIMTEIVTEDGVKYKEKVFIHLGYVDPESIQIPPDLRLPGLLWGSWIRDHPLDGTFLNPITVSKSSGSWPFREYTEWVFVKPKGWIKPES